MSSYSQRSFSKAEISPSLYGRTDLVAYATGAKTVRNFILRRQGGLDNRPGTEYAGNVPTVARIVPFVFNASQAYVLEFTNGLLRFVRQGAYVGGGYSIASPYLSADLPGLQWSQSADVMTFVHPSYPIYELSRLAETNWTLLPVVFGPSVAAPANLTAAPGGLPFEQIINWRVTTLSDGGEESYASTATGILGSLHDITHAPVTLSWDAVTGAVGYNVYKSYYTFGVGEGTYGLVGTTVTPGFNDSSFTPDFFTQPPQLRTLFNAPNEYPAAVGTYQQRRVFGGSNNHPERIWTSRSGDLKNFTVSVPSQDDDAITATLVSDQVNQIKHFSNAAAFLAFTEGGEWVIAGDSAGIMRPTDINPINFSDDGCNLLPPLKLGRRVLFVEAQSTIVRDIAKDPYVGMIGTDLTVFSSHLFDGFTIVDWAYARKPHSIVWAVRSDGVLLGLTDVADQQVQGWHRHDTLGTVENVCAISENGESRLYLVVNRNGTRMMERMASRFFTDIQDAIFMDAAMTYDGRNTNASRTMALSGGATWSYDELLTITASFSQFSAGEVGNAVFLTGPDGEVIRFTLSAYTSPTVMQGFASRTVPFSLQGTSTSTWSRAVDQVTGLGHLEGQAVSVFADGYVVANPNNPEISLSCIVSGGSITLDRPYAYIHAGLPYVSDLCTLDLDTPSGASLRDKNVSINRLGIECTASRGVFAGASAPVDDATIEPLYELKVRDPAVWTDPVTEITRPQKMNIKNDWQGNGSVFIRQVDPVPLSILAVIPTGYIPGGSS